MNIGIFSACFGHLDFDEYWDYVYISHKKYCERYNIDFTLFEEDLTSDDSFAPNWSKILILKENVDDYDWLIWLDADLMIMNHTIDIREWIDDNYNFIIEKDLYTDSRSGKFVNVNSGFMMMKGKCEWTRRFVYEILYDDNDFTRNRMRPFFEQSSIESILSKKENFYDSTLVRNNELHKFWPTFPRKTECWIKREDNYSDYFVKNYIGGRTFREGDFSVHFSGIDNKSRKFLYERAQKYVVWNDNDFNKDYDGKNLL